MRECFCGEHTTLLPYALLESGDPLCAGIESILNIRVALQIPFNPTWIPPVIPVYALYGYSQEPDGLLPKNGIRTIHLR
jgi:hypothetical protein